jgi:glyoxylase-like metal-dependent hydrolase (beta-lactamase superfamily II)
VRGDAIRIAEGVYGLVGGPVNLYLIDDPVEGLTLIDTGLPGWGLRILELLASIGREPSEIRRVLVTHADVDHVGSLAVVAAATGAEIAAGEKTAGYLSSRATPPHLRFPVSIPVALMSAAIGARPAVGRTLSDGEKIDTPHGLRAIATPGHTPDHFAYYLEREGLLFAGDLYRNVRGLEPYPRFSWDREKQEESARRVDSLGCSVVCPGHGKVWREGDARLPR